MGYQGTIEIGLRSFPYAIPDVEIITQTGGVPPAFNTQDFYCSLRAVRKVTPSGFPLHAASYIVKPQGIVETVLDPDTPGGDLLSDSASIGDYTIFFPNQTTGNPAARPVYCFRRNIFNGLAQAAETQKTRIFATGLYFANSGQKPFAMNPYRFSLQGTVRLAGKACPAHSFENTAGPDDINPTYIFNNAPLSFKVPLEVHLPGSDILGQYDMKGCPYGEWDMVLLDKNTAPAGVYRKQLNWYPARGFIGEPARTESVLNVFASVPSLHSIWSQSTPGSGNYRVNIWPYGWTVLFYTGGTGPNGPAQKFELAVLDPFMKNFALVKFIPQDETAAGILDRWTTSSGDVKLDDQGTYYLHNGNAADQLTMISSFNVSPFTYQKIAPVQLPPVTLPCYAPCGPFLIPG